MTRKKVTPKAEPKVTPKVEPKAAPKVEPKAAPKVELKVKKFVALRTAQFHPFQKIRIPLGTPGVILEEDSWTLCQVEAGLIKEI